MIFGTQEMTALPPGDGGQSPADRPRAPEQPAVREAHCARADRAVAIVHELTAHPLYPVAATPVRDPGQPVRLLIADDYADAAESLAMLLSNVGVETAVAFDGEQALARAIRWQPQICVLDIEMPKLDGRELARRIRRQAWAERPLLIALTGWTSPQDASRAMEAGFDHYMIKPVEPLKIVRLIQNFLAGRSNELGVS